MSKHLQKSWGARRVYALGCFALVLASGAMAENTPLDSAMVYQLADLDQASAAPVQIVSNSPLLFSVPTPAVELATSSAIEAVSSSAASAEDASASELVAKTTLSPGITIDGLACNILHTPTGKHRWSILQYDLSTDTENQKAVFVSDEERVIQSVACSADGSQVLMAIQDSVGGDSEVYLIDQTNHETQRLTDNETEDLDVSMSQDGRMISWQGRLADDREAVFVRSIAEDGSYTDVALGSKFPFTQPSLSDNGEWLVLVNKRNRYDHIMRYRVATGEFTTVKIINSNRYKVADPSISNDGTKVLWTEDDRAQHLILADLEAGTRKTVVTKYHPARLSHPYLSGDGQAVMYSVNREDKRQNYLLVLLAGQTTRIGKALSGEAQYLGGQIRVAVGITLYHLRVMAGENGSVTVTPLADEGYLSGSNISIKAVPSSGYQVNVWSGTDQCAGDETCDFIMPAENLEITVQFEVIPKFQLTLSAENGVAVMSSSSDSDGYLAGTEITLDAQPDFGYLAPTWVGIDGCDAGYHCSFTMPARNVDVVAKFEERIPVTWVKQFGTTGTDSVANIAQAPDNSLYVAGNTDGVLEGQTYQGGADGYLAKFSSSGERIWSRQIGTSANDEVKGVAVDDEGSVYVFGNTSGVFSGQESLGLDDYFLAKYNAEGTQLWLRQFGSEDEDNAAAITTQGTFVYLSGDLGGNYSSDYLRGSYLIKYDLEGNQLLNHWMGYPNINVVRQVVLDGKGNIYFVGGTYWHRSGNSSLNYRIPTVQRVNELRLGSSLEKYSAPRVFDYRYTYWLVIDNNNTASALFPNKYGGGDYLIKFSGDYLEDGIIIKTGVLERNGSSVAAALDSKGHYHIIGDVTNLPDSLSENTSAYVLTLDADGNRVDYYSLGSDENDRASSVIVANDEKSIYVAGVTEGVLNGETSAGGTDVFITKIAIE